MHDAVMRWDTHPRPCLQLACLQLTCFADTSASIAFSPFTLHRCVALYSCSIRLSTEQDLEKRQEQCIHKYTALHPVCSSETQLSSTPQQVSVTWKLSKFCERTASKQDIRRSYTTSFKRVIHASQDASQECQQAEGALCELVRPVQLATAVPRHLLTVAFNCVSTESKGANDSDR